MDTVYVVKMFFHGMHGFYFADIFQDSHVYIIRLCISDIGFVPWIFHFCNSFCKMLSKVFHNKDNSQNPLVPFLIFPLFRFCLPVFLFLQYFHLVLLQCIKFSYVHFTTFVEKMGWNPMILSAKRFI